MNWIAKRFLMQLLDLAVFLAVLFLLFAICYGALTITHLHNGGAILFLSPSESYDTLLNRA